MIKAWVVDKHADVRGHFMEIFRASGHEIAFVQDSISFNRARGTLRGLHTQVGPLAQTQLLTVLCGRVLDVIVTFGCGGFQINYNVMDSFAANQVLIPPAALHGFVTLTDEAVLLYKSNRYFEPGIDRKVNPFDRTLSIDWQVSPESAIVGEADRRAPSFDSFVAGLNHPGNQSLRA